MTKNNKGDRLKNSSLKNINHKKIQKMEKIGELVSLPIFYLAVTFLALFADLVCMPFINHYAFGRCYDRERGQEIASRISKIQICLLVIMLIAGITFAIGFYRSGGNFVPFF